MTSASSIPAIQGNVLATTREEKLNDLMVQWYQVTAEATPPPPDDPNLLLHHTEANYYNTSEMDQGVPASAVVPSVPQSGVMERISVDWDAVRSTISSALANTTGRETGEGYGTCVIQSFDGQFDGEGCLFKLIIVAVSFNFSSSEYQTDQDVVAFGFWIYFFHTDLPFSYDQAVSEPIHGESLVYQIPPDMNIIGRRYMTVEEFDQYTP